MSNSRERMNEAIKGIILPALRQKGFTGSFPHLRRINKDSVDLISFQFNKYGGSFVVNLAKCSSKVDPSKITALDINDKIQRLSPTMQGDYWFRFDKKLLFKDIYSIVANEVLQLLNDQAESWWQNTKSSCM